MEIETRDRSGVRILDLTGRLTFDGGAKAVYACVREALDSNHPWIILHLAGVSFLDSTGLGVLVSCHTSARTRDGVVKLLAPSPKVEDILRITNTYDLFEVQADEDEAIRSFHKDP